MLGDPRPSFWRSTSVFALAGCCLLWVSFPPVGFSWLAWLAPLPWLYLIERPSELGRPRYWALWLVGLVFWLAMLQGIRLAHWLNHFGWLALSAYLATYLPIFVGLSRWAVRRGKLSVIAVAPVVWTGLELARGHLFTGFSMALLGHSQFEHPTVIQVADFGGAYAVSFLMMLVAGCLVSCLPIGGRRWRVWPGVLLSSALIATWLYGSMRLEASRRVEPTGTLKVALIQGLFNTHFDPNSDLQREYEMYLHYRELTEQAVAAHRDLDLIVWPESVFSPDIPEILLADDVELTPESMRGAQARIDEFTARTKRVAESINRRSLADDSERGNTHLLVGAATYRVRGSEAEPFNAALLIDPAGEVVQRYYKMHRVMVGEYMPFGEYFPWIKGLPSLSAGDSPAAFRVGDCLLTPSICFESAVPHLIRSQFNELARQGLKPNLLVNLTHDGWFWGSTILDFQLAGAVFRAVELRAPCLVAANAGISASIDEAGRVQERGPRQGDAVIITEVEYRERGSLYAQIGDAFAGVCLLLTIVLAAIAWWHRRPPKRQETGRRVLAE